MQITTSIEEVEKRINRLYLFALQIVAEAVGVECPAKYKKDELRERLINIAKGIEQPLPEQKRKKTVDEILFNGDLALAILELNEKNRPHD